MFGAILVMRCKVMCVVLISAALRFGQNCMRQQKGYGCLCILHALMIFAHPPPEECVLKG